MPRLTRAAVVLVIAVSFGSSSDASAFADPAPTLIECPDHTHVWNINQCNDQNPYGFPGSGGGGSGGLLGLIGRVLGGIL